MVDSNSKLSMADPTTAPPSFHCACSNCTMMNSPSAMNIYVATASPVADTGSSRAESSSRTRSTSRTSRRRLKADCAICSMWTRHIRRVIRTEAACANTTPSDPAPARPRYSFSQLQTACTDIKNPGRAGDTLSWRDALIERPLTNDSYCLQVPAPLPMTS